METITVFIPDEDAQKFLLFQKHYKDFSLLLESGVFEQKNSTILLDFNKDGVIFSIRRNDFLYSARHEVDK